MSTCLPQSCPTRNYYEYVPTLPNACFCAAPFGIGLRLRSPSISNFIPYRDQFDYFITSNVYAKPNTPLSPYQLYVDSIAWEPGPRLRMFLLFFPEYITNDSSTFTPSEIWAIANQFAGFTIPGNDTFGPYDLLNFTAQGPYSDGMPFFFNNPLCQIYCGYIMHVSHVIKVGHFSWRILCTCDENSFFFVLSL